MSKLEKEKRFVTADIEIRSDDNDQEEYIVGYALKFERWSEALGWGFKEIIKRGALDKTDMSDVVAYFNHNVNMPLARNSIANGKGSLQLEADDIGLRFKFIPTDTSYAKDLKENMRAGIVNKCSFAFYLDYEDKSSQEWKWASKQGEYDERTINRIAKISDVSVVVNPAYKDTESVVSQRCLDEKDAYKQSIEQQEKNKKLKRKLELELELRNPSSFFMQ